MIVKNLWAKELKTGDIIIDMELVDSKYGPINRFTVQRADNSETIAAVEDALTRVREVLA